jgi:hypothetical protein
MLPDVPQPRGPEQRIDQSVQQHIAVGMSNDAVAVRYAYPAEHDRIAGSECMHVDA